MRSAHITNRPLTANDFRKGLVQFIEGLDHTPVKTLQELIDFNKAHESECLPPGCYR